MQDMVRIFNELSLKLQYSFVKLGPNMCCAVVTTKNLKTAPGFVLQKATGVSDPKIDRNACPHFVARVGTIWKTKTSTREIRERL